MPKSKGRPDALFFVIPDEVIFVGGLNHDYDVEGWDRDSMVLPYAQDILIEELLKINPHTIIVMVAGSPVEMPWKDMAKAIVWNYYAGMESGTALAEVLLGRVCPCGKLPETFPALYSDTVTFFPQNFPMFFNLPALSGLLLRLLPVGPAVYLALQAGLLPVGLVYAFLARNKVPRRIPDIHVAAQQHLQAQQRRYLIQRLDLRAAASPGMHVFRIAAYDGDPFLFAVPGEGIGIARLQPLRGNGHSDERLQ